MDGCIIPFNLLKSKVNVFSECSGLGTCSALWHFFLGRLCLCVNIKDTHLHFKGVRILGVFIILISTICMEVMFYSGLKFRLQCFLKSVIHGWWKHCSLHLFHMFSISVVGQSWTCPCFYLSWSNVLFFAILSCSAFWSLTCVESGSTIIPFSEVRRTIVRQGYSGTNSVKWIMIVYLIGLFVLIS